MEFWKEVFSHLLLWAKRSDGEQSARVLSVTIAAAQRWVATPGRSDRAEWTQVYCRLFNFDLANDASYLELGIDALYEKPIPFPANFAGFLLQKANSERAVLRISKWLGDWFETKAAETRGISIWLKLDRLVKEKLASEYSDGWRLLQEIVDRHRPLGLDAWGRLAEKHRANETVRGRVLTTNNFGGGFGIKNRLGFVVDIGVNAFLPLAEADIPRETRQDFVGQEIDVEIVRMDEATGQVDVSQRASRQRSVASLTLGTEVHGVVKAVYDYGAFVDIGFMDALLHVSEIDEAQAKRATEVLSAGQAVKAKVLKVDATKSRVWLTLKDKPLDDVTAWEWKDRWQAAWNAATNDTNRRSDMADQAEEWLSKFDLKQRGWTSVWKELWKVTDGNFAARVNLAAIADKWLESVSPDHPRWASIWLILWNAKDSGSPDRFRSLVTRGRKWLAGQGPRVDWDLVWSMLWNLPHLRDETMGNVARLHMQLNPPPDARWIEDQLLMSMHEIPK